MLLPLPFPPHHFSSSDLRAFEWYLSAVLLLHPVSSEERLNDHVFHFSALGSHLFPSLISSKP